MAVTPYLRKVQYYETDQMGVVHHANYIRWFEETRVDYMEKIGFGYHRAVEAEIDFVVMGVSCEYKSMTRFGETVEIHLRIAHIDAVRMTLQYRVLDSTTGVLRATGESKHCYYHSRRKRLVALPKELPELYEMFVRASEKGHD